MKTAAARPGPLPLAAPGRRTRPTRLCRDQEGAAGGTGPRSASRLESQLEEHLCTAVKSCSSGKLPCQKQAASTKTESPENTSQPHRHRGVLPFLSEKIWIFLPETTFWWLSLQPVEVSYIGVAQFLHITS